MPVPGFVYVLSNAELQEFVKVGMSNEVARGLIEINTGAGVVGKWSAYGSIMTNDMRQLEAKAHLALANSRVAGSAGTEIFRCSARDAAVAVIQQAIASCLKIYENSFPAEQTPAEEAAFRAEQERIKAEQARVLWVIQDVCRRFPEAVALWAKAIEITARKDGVALGGEAADLVNEASRRLSSLARSWGLTGYEDRLLQHVAAICARRAEEDPASVFAKVSRTALANRTPESRTPL